MSALKSGNETERHASGVSRQLSDHSLPWPSDEQILADLGGGDSELNRLRVLLAQAEEVLAGKVRHCYAGGCPDETNGWSSLDPECPACRALAAVREGR